MSYEINFASETSAVAVRDAVVARYGVDPGLIYVGPLDELGAYPGPDPLAMVTWEADPANQFDCVLGSGAELERASGGQSELDMAVDLCRELGTRALVDDGGFDSECWFLVTADGWRGRVIVDEDALDDGNLVIAYAFQPVPSEPELPVREPPYWQVGWYRDGVIPE